MKPTRNQPLQDFPKDRFAVIQVESEFTTYAGAGVSANLKSEIKRSRGQKVRLSMRFDFRAGTDLLLNAPRRDWCLQIRVATNEMNLMLQASHPRDTLWRARMR